MIDRQEILEFSRELGLAADIVEKDYVLGWLLAAIYSHADLKSAWRKRRRYLFEEMFFRDLSILRRFGFHRYGARANQRAVSPRRIGYDIAAWMYNNCGIEIPGDAVSFEVYSNPRGKQAVKAKSGIEDRSNDAEAFLESSWI